MIHGNVPNEQHRRAHQNDDSVFDCLFKRRCHVRNSLHQVREPRQRVSTFNFDRDSEGCCRPALSREQFIQGPPRHTCYQSPVVSNCLRSTEKCGITGAVAQLTSGRRGDDSDLNPLGNWLTNFHARSDLVAHQSVFTRLTFRSNFAQLLHNRMKNIEANYIISFLFVQTEWSTMKGSKGLRCKKLPAMAFRT